VQDFSAFEQETSGCDKIKNSGTKVDLQTTPIIGRRAIFATCQSDECGKIG
jgi:hypothetical protein